MTQLDHHVLVAGAGPAGLATAVAAARHGPRVLLVEQRPALSSYPRATGVSTRTMEILRTPGLDGAVRAGAIDAGPVMAIRRTLAGPPLQTRSLGYPSAEQTRGVSPVTALCCPQDHVERVLLGHLCDLCDGRLTVLTGGGAEGWRAAAGVLAAYEAPVAALSAGSDLVDDGVLARRYGLGDEGAVLVRLDGHCGPALPAGDAGHLTALTDTVDAVLGTADLLLPSPAR